MNAKIATIAFCTLTLFSLGCSNQLKTYPVSGKVEFDGGNPVVVGIVEFKSIDHSVNARGQIKPDGSFQLTTFRNNDGAVVGRHKCVVLQMVIGENIPTHLPSTIGVVAPKYASYATSGLEFDVSADNKNEFIIKVDGVLKTQPPPGSDHKH